MALSRRDKRRQETYAALESAFLKLLLENGRASIVDIRDSVTIPTSVSPRLLGGMTTALISKGIIRHGGYRSYIDNNGQRRAVAELELVSEEAARARLNSLPAVSNSDRSTSRRPHQTPRNQATAMPLQVNKALKQVRLDGKAYDVSSSAIILFEALLQAQGGWVSASSELELSKPSAVKRKLPPELRAILETQSGKGYRFKRE